MTRFSDPVRTALELFSGAYLRLQLRETRLTDVEISSSDAVIVDANAPAARLIGQEDQEQVAVGIPSLVIGRSLSELVVLNEIREEAMSAAMVLSPLTELELGEELRMRRLLAGNWMILRGKRVSEREVVVIIEPAAPSDWPLASAGPLVLVSYLAAAPFRISRCSSSVLPRLGDRKSVVIHMPFPELLPAASRSELKLSLETFRNSGTQSELELHYPVLNYDGTHRQAHDFILPLGDAAGVHGFISHIWIEQP